MHVPVMGLPGAFVTSTTCLCDPQGFKLDVTFMQCMRIGTECMRVGTKYVRVGTECMHLGIECTRVGIERMRVGTERISV